ncbi:phospholipid transport system transporter-binding protein [Pseudomonas cuatrocienegasensis]|uniref:Phospholipid transport system transporter-binding protein n=1 Tax=Pseudomonas cuatrocienegasensis TaxID=543360 RepID=A0ABY1BC08_9PSED|nr:MULTISPECIES: STAS domain-containing protein [Pseudomonas]OEC35512.1 anti-anti-sigma factor [Pseudomonas sp. 21C1]SEQ48246.1 phospholipid transport system transporter-binding protein [Pseudomonas cuatrocienegasensis]
MSRASIVEQAPGLLLLSGELDYRSGPQVREDGRRLLQASAAATCVIDCAGVLRASSVGLSLLLAFMRDAQALGKTLEVRALPEDMRQIAGVSGLLEILPLQA